MKSDKFFIIGMCSIILISSLPLVTAYPYGKLDIMAKELKGQTDYETVMNIDSWVENNIKHKFYWYPRGISRTLYDMTGDCSDKTVLKQYMLRNNKIDTRLVHGFADSKLHDWYEVKLNNTWWTHEDRYFNLIKKLGYGLW